MVIRASPTNQATHTESQEVAPFEQQYTEFRKDDSQPAVVYGNEG